MITSKEAYEFVSKKLETKPDRLRHVVGVAQMALYLNNLHNLGLDNEKLLLAGLLHDAWKYLDEKTNMEIMQKDYDEKTISDIIKIPSIWHGFVGSIMAKEELGINDEDIINGIRYHGVGRIEMSMFEKVIFISDYIELTRKDEVFDGEREIAYHNINQALLEIMINKNKYVKKSGYVVYPKTDAIIAYYQKENK